ncbi:MAG: PhoX family phosphatase [Pseudomonadota bacterium]
MWDDEGVVNPRAQVDPLDQVFQRRLTRRAMLQRSALGGAALALPGMSGCASTATDAPALPPSRYNFDEIERGSSATHVLADGYELDVLVRWGDPLFTDAPKFDPQAQGAASQARQFGYNCDFVGFYPLPPDADGPARGLLCVNHEYTSSLLMFPGVAADFPTSMSAAHCATEMAAQGGSVVEIVLREGRWQVQLDSPYNRRIMATQTPMDVSGPAKGSPRLATRADPDGASVSGTFNNCAGGITPWGTYLMAEENFNGYFAGELPADHAEAENHARYGVPGGWFQWAAHFDEFDIGRDPNGPNRYGWVVEVDILNPRSRPKKRTALGRFKHEGAESIVAPDGRLVVYMGDDQQFEYVYKFVSDDRYNPHDRSANMDLLDHGTLYVARFDDDGGVVWLPLTFGLGPLTPANGFDSQADVVIEARLAADLLGATPMDRPEDVEAHPDNGRAYVMLTNNTRRSEDNLNAANPRPRNFVGQIVEITTPGGDHAALRGRWDFVVRCGDPENPEMQASWHPATSANGWFGSPDNCAFDARGRMWIATDGNPATGAADGLWGVETDGPLRGAGKAFFRAPVGAEVCGPRFAPDGKSLFLAVQHPGDGRQATFENPTSRWPDFAPEAPPRPSVVAIYRKDGGLIGD